MNETSAGAVDAIELLDRAERRIAALEARLERMESGAAGGAASIELSAAAASRPAVLMEVSSRRGLFKVAGAVATAAVAHSLVSASPAAATVVTQGANDLDALAIGRPNTGQSETGLSSAPAAAAVFSATHTATSGNIDAIRGTANGSPGAAGVAGSSTDGYGVYGSTTKGYAVFANGRLGLAAHVLGSGAPNSGDYLLGDIIRDSVGNVYACVGAGSAAPNAQTPAVFRKITGPARAGQMHLLASPLRAYDSRPGAAAASGGDGVIGAGLERMISLTQGRNATSGATSVAVPGGASGAAISLSVTSTTGSIGWIGCFANGSTYPGTANITWFGAGQTLSVTTMCGVDSAQRMKIYCGSNPTHVIVDVLGYYA